MGTHRWLIKTLTPILYSPPLTLAMASSYVEFTCLFLDPGLHHMTCFGHWGVNNVPKARTWNVLVWLSISSCTRPLPRDEHTSESPLVQSGWQTLGAEPAQPMPTLPGRSKAATAVVTGSNYLTELRPAKFQLTCISLRIHAYYCILLRVCGGGHGLLCGNSWRIHSHLHSVLWEI